MPDSAMPDAFSGAFSGTSSGASVDAAAGELSGRHLVLGVSAGVAGFKAAELARSLQRAGATVQVVMSESATRFVTPVTFQALTGRTVYTDQWDPRVANNMPHIDLSRGADAIMVVPASADFMAKLAHGLCDELLSLMCVARDCPLLIAPAMNRQMWNHPATQRNAALLRADGVQVLGPASGDQACGETGDGRMLEPAALLEALIAFFAPKLLAGKRVLITAGPTFEAIDPVRGITNLSSGKMGYAIARACQHAGAKVHLISGPTALAVPEGVQTSAVRSAQEMFDAVHASLASAAHSLKPETASTARNPASAVTTAGRAVSGVDLFIAVAAVADWRVANFSSRKLKKTDGKRLPELKFTENPDILSSVAQLANPPYCVGFAAESENLEQNAIAKRIRKGVPLLVANLGPQTFGRDDNELLLVDAVGLTRLPRADKNSLATALVAEIAQRLQQQSASRRPAQRKKPR
jgi:phosphopantothenoylcysteine decarboxylase / phosphopantothenate---cysteine ligase